MKAEDVAALLDSDHVAGGEGLAVPDVVYSVDDGDCRKRVTSASGSIKPAVLSSWRGMDSAARRSDEPRLRTTKLNQQTHLATTALKGLTKKGQVISHKNPTRLQYWISMWPDPDLISTVSQA